MHYTPAHFLQPLRPWRYADFCAKAAFTGDPNLMKMRHSSAACLLFAICFVLTSCKLGRSSKVIAQPSPSPTQTQLVDGVFQRYMEALGGQEAIDRVTTYYTRGSFVLSVISEPGKFETWNKDPNKNLSIIEFPRIGSLKRGYDGQNRWVQTPVGTFTDSGPQEMSEVEHDADIYQAGKLQKLYQSVRLDYKARISGHDVDVVEGTPDRGPAEKLFFNSQTGLLERWDMARRTPGRGTVFVKVHLDDYKSVDGVKVPYTVRLVFESFQLTLKVEEVKHNIPIDDAIFQKPSAK